MEKLPFQEFTSLEKEAGKKRLKKTLFQVAWKSPKHFESLHRTICNKYWEILQWTLINFSFKSTGFLKHFRHNQPQQRSCEEQFLPKLLPEFYQKLWSYVFLGLCRWLFWTNLNVSQTFHVEAKFRSEL